MGTYNLKDNAGGKLALVGKDIRPTGTLASGTLSYVVTETDADGWYKDYTGTITVSALPISAPTVVTAPTISGTLIVGSILSSDDGVWANEPTDFYRSWDRRTAGSSNAWTAIGVFTQGYTLKDVDVGFEFRVRTTAVNSGGTSASSASNTLGPIVAASSNVARNLIPYDNTKGANAGSLVADRQVSLPVQNLTAGWTTVVSNLPTGLTFNGTHLVGAPTKTSGATEITFTQSKSGQTDFVNKWVFLHDVLDWSPTNTPTITGMLSSDTNAAMVFANQSALTSKSLRKAVGREVYSAALFNDGVGWTGDSVGSGKYRSELELGSASRFRVGERTYFAMRSFVEGMIPPDRLSGNQYQIIWQIHHVPEQGDAFVPPPMAVCLVKDSSGNGMLKIITRSTMVAHPTNADLIETVRADTIPFALGQWHDMTGYFQMGPDGTGSLYLNVDGTQYLALDNIAFGFSEPNRKETDGSFSKVYYWKGGLYTAPRPIVTLSAVHKFEVILGKTAIPNLAGRSRNPFVTTSATLLSAPVLADWTAANAAPLTVTPYGLRIEGDGVTGHNPEASRSLGTIDPTTLGLMAFPITIEESVGAVSSELMLGVDGKSYSHTLYSNQKSLQVGGWDLPEGTYWQVVLASEMKRYEADGVPGVYTTANMPSGAAPVKLRLRSNQVTPAGVFAKTVTDNPPHNSRITYGKVYAQVSTPKVPIVITFDDSENTIATDVQARLDAIGAKASAYAVPLSSVHKGTTYNYATNKMTVAQWAAWAAAGHAIAAGSPGDISDTNLNVNTSVQDVIDSHNVVKAWIAANNLRTQTAGAGIYDDDHRCYSGTNPSTNHDLAGYTGAPLTTTGLNIQTGQVAFTLDAAVTGLAVGFRARGLGLARGTLIATLASDGLSGTFSTAALLTGKVQSLFEDYGQPFFRGKLQAALRAAGVKTCRATAVGLTPPAQFVGFGFGTQDLLLTGKGWGPSSTQAQVTNWINENMRYGTALLTYIHRVVASPTGVNMSPDLFQFMLDGLNAKVQAGQAEFLTIGQFHEKYRNAQPPA